MTYRFEKAASWVPGREYREFDASFDRYAAARSASKTRRESNISATGTASGSVQRNYCEAGSC